MIQKLITFWPLIFGQLYAFQAPATSATPYSVIKKEIHTNTDKSENHKRFRYLIYIHTDSPEIDLSPLESIEGVISYTYPQATKTDSGIYIHVIDFIIR